MVERTGVEETKIVPSIVRISSEIGILERHGDVVSAWRWFWRLTNRFVWTQTRSFFPTRSIEYLTYCWIFVDVNQPCLLKQLAQIRKHPCLIHQFLAIWTFQDGSPPLRGGDWGCNPQPPVEVVGVRGKFDRTSAVFNACVQAAKISLSNHNVGFSLPFPANSIQYVVKCTFVPRIEKSNPYAHSHAPTYEFVQMQKKDRTKFRRINVYTVVQLHWKILRRSFL